MDKIKEMFENSGNWIKKIAFALFFIGIVSAIILGIIYGRTPSGYYNELQFNFFAFIGIVIGVIIANTIECLFLYAFGDLVDNVKTLANSSHAESKKDTNIAPDSKNDSVNYADTWVCKKCGSRNKISNVSCKDCGEYR